MKIEVNCTVRFLNATGGGRVSRIKGDIAYVEDEDGFEIPTPIRECIRVDEGDTFMPAYKPPVINKSKKQAKPKEEQSTQTNKSKAERVSTKPSYEPPFSIEEEEEFTPPAPHLLLKASGAVEASLFFLPLDEANLDSCNYELFFVNDSMYSFYYTLSRKTFQGYELVHHGCSLPNKDIFIQEIVRTELSLWEHLNIQIIAFSENPKKFIQSYDIEQRLSLKDFRSSSKLVENKLFEDKAIIYPLVKESRQIAKKQENLDKSLEELSNQWTNKDKPQPQKTEKPLPKGMKLDRNGDYVVDLHIDELLDSTSGMDRAAILNYQLDKFKEIMKANIKFRERRIVFIHGKGDGILRAKILEVLQKKFPKCRTRDASFSEYSYGATLVTIK